MSTHIELKKSNAYRRRQANANRTKLVEGKLENVETRKWHDILQDLTLNDNISTKPNVESSNDESMLSYIYNLVKPPIGALKRQRNDHAEDEIEEDESDVRLDIGSSDKSVVGLEDDSGDSDNESLYEDDDCVTRTVFRSNSFDEPIDELFTNNKCELNKPISREFSIQDFSDSFNLSDEENDILKGLENVEDKEDVEIGEVTGIVEVDLINKQSLRKVKTEEYPSLNSSDSIQFDDIVAGDILGNLNEIESIGDLESLDVNEEKIVVAIVNRLNNQLKPTLDALAKESQKYEIMKKVYKLPSISKLNSEYRELCMQNIKPKNFKLEFQDEVVKELIKEERERLMKEKVEKEQVVSVKDQIRMNFNKFRQLNTIVEESSFESLDESVAMQCMQNGYSNLKDTRKVASLETDELKAMLKLIDDGKLKNGNKVGKLVSLFETEKRVSTYIHKMDILELKRSINMELENRSKI